MAIKTKKYFADRIILALQNAYPNIDFKIQDREVFLAVDDIVNAMAKDNYIENMKLFGANTDEGFITTWDGENALTVVDEEDKQSYLVMPATFAALPMNNGIVEVWSTDYEFGSVRIRRHEDVRRTRTLMSGNMQGELGGYPRGNLFVFDQVDVGKNFSETFGMRGVIKDSSAIGITDPYPIPGNLVEEVINKAVMFFTQKRFQVTDTVRDGNDAIKRN